ncbi:DUF6441 family protein [Pseudogemmobacter sp. W21_MBD1_M6]|uniref:DUF6441 family protein n=1 Tax=Pseudogemmobacter sp. W21_MBD1_M6 TaxID=3240271 RepID=UPI003F9E5C1E
MRIDVAVVGDILAQMREEVAAGERAVSQSMSVVATGLKTDWRMQIIGAGLGPKLARTIQSRKYPVAKDSLNAAALVWANAPVPAILQRGERVLSRRETAGYGGGSTGGGVTLHIDARGAQAGVAEQIDAKLRAALPEIQRIAIQSVAGRRNRGYAV